MLDKWWIRKYFSYVLWSSYISKSTKHIEKFIEYTSENDFAQHAVFIGDGGRDKEIADASNINFIGIWENVITDNKISAISELLDILEIRE
jgi:phosphoglycolate phosphatase-like HAD superfamily hydrolase